jgi:hypothetical protein
MPRNVVTIHKVCEIPLWHGSAVPEMRVLADKICRRRAKVGKVQRPPQ